MKRLGPAPGRLLQSRSVNHGLLNGDPSAAGLHIGPESENL